MEFQICCGISIIFFGTVSLDSLFLHINHEQVCRNADGYTRVINVWTKATGSQNTRLPFEEQPLKDIKVAGIKLPGMA